MLDILLVKNKICGDYDINTRGYSCLFYARTQYKNLIM